MVSVFFQKKFGLNRTPKILVNVANFFLKDQMLLPMSCFEEPTFFEAHFVFFSLYQAKFYLIENWTTPSDCIGLQNLPK